MADLFGSKVNIYGYNAPSSMSPSMASYTTVFDNKTLIESREFYIPYGTGASLLNSEKLFITGNLNMTTVGDLDLICPLWQQSTIIVAGKNKWTGASGIVEAILQQFPNIIDIDDYLSNYNVVCMTPEGNPNIMKIIGLTGGNQLNYVTFNRTTQGFSDELSIPFFKFGDNFRRIDGTGTYTFGVLVAMYYNGSIYKYEPTGTAYDNRNNGSYGNLQSPTIYATNNVREQTFYNTFTEGFTPTPTTPQDPYAPGGPSEPGGGGGTFDDTSDSNPIPSDPTISATDTGFMTAFATNLAGIQSLATSLWSDIFSAIQPGGTLEGTVEALKNIVASPYDAILGCHIIPVNVPVGTSKNVKLYGVLPSTVSLPVAASQWVHKDCGTLTIQPYDGSYLDYAPYSKVTSLYLPFVGVVSVDIDIIMNTTIGVYYKIDIISGQCIAFITKNGDVYFQYQGQCAVPLPVTSVDWSTTVSAGLGIVGSIGSIAGSAVGGALGGGGAAGALAGAVKGTIGEAGSIAQNVMNSKPDIKSGSGVGGSAALMGCKNPYLIIERPRKSTPAIDDLYQNHWTGYPSNIAARIGDLEGYTEVSRVFVNRTNATAAEKQEIERLLNEGVYL